MRYDGLFPDNKSLTRYLHDISALPLVSIDDEIALAKRIKQGDRNALRKLINANLRFVISIAKNYQNKGMPVTDLINEGNLGLIEAALRFDETRGYKFISYAVWWIRQSILQAIQDYSRLVRLPQNKIGKIKKIGKTQSHLEQELEREPTANEVADALDLSSDEIEEMAEYATRTLPLDAPLNDRDSGLLIEILEDPQTNEPDSGLIEQSFRSELDEALKELKEREADIVRLYFGIGLDRPLTLEEISKRYHLTRERVRQIKERALVKLRHQACCKKLKGYLD